jgi:hypothetical protein
MTQETTMLEAFVPDFSGLLSPAWAELLSGARVRAAERHEFLQMSDYKLDREDYLKIFAETGDYAKQCSEVARSFCAIFGIHLAIKLGIPHGIRFARYDADCDRILALVPLPTVKRILDFCGERRHRSLKGLKRGAFEPLLGFMPELGDRPSEAVTECLQLLDRHAVGTLLRAFSNPGIEKKAIAAIAVKRAGIAFSNSIDRDKFRAATARRRSEKYAPGRSVDAEFRRQQTNRAEEFLNSLKFYS